MREANFTVSSMHGDMPQKERDAIMAEFRQGASRVIIATDVWARGIVSLMGTLYFVNFPSFFFFLRMSNKYRWSLITTCQITVSCTYTELVVLVVLDVRVLVSLFWKVQRRSHIFNITTNTLFSSLAINLVKNDDLKILRDIEQYYSTQITEMPMNCKYSSFDFIVFS